MTENQPPSGAGEWSGWARGHRLLVASCAHVALFALSWLVAFGLAYNFRNFDAWFTVFFLPLLPVVLIIKGVVFWAMGLYRSSWRYVSMRDAMQVTKAAFISFTWVFGFYYALINVSYIARFFGIDAGEYVAFGGRDFPDSVLILDVAGTIALVCGARIGVRFYHEEIQPLQEGAAPKLLILGAGSAGENVVREILRQPVLQYRIEGFLDDDQSKWGTRIHDVEVLGGINKIKEVCEELSIDEILISMPSASQKQVRRVIGLCEGANLRFKTLPAMADLISGRATYRQIRDVSIHDLLGRAPVQLDTAEIAKFINDRTVMVTGAGGSIGSEMCRQIARFKPRCLLLVEQAEQNLFEIDRELRADFSDIKVVPYIADIGDAGRVGWIFKTERPTAVFHAAAHKHVPMMELNPGEALKNNIIGTRTVADAASANGCEKFVMISTDKAVNPTSIMGGSKRVAEMYTQALNERVETQFVTVRFGNVLGSSGSVVPIFKEQIARGGPVTVTHPDMVRYFMTIPEAAQLVLQSASMGHGGEVFVLDMGQPVKIVDLARDLITLSGFRPGEDIEITYSGVRPGEKLYEELSIEGEDVARTAHPKIGIWQKRSEDWGKLLVSIEKILCDADGLSREDARRKIHEVVPEFYLEAPEAPPTVRQPAEAEADGAAAGATK